MGGRCAEELIFGADKVTGGASGDFMGTTNIAEAMVKTLAMSDKLGMSKSNNAYYGVSHFFRLQCIKVY